MADTALSGLLAAGAGAHGTIFNVIIIIIDTIIIIIIIDSLIDIDNNDNKHTIITKELMIINETDSADSIDNSCA